MTHDTRCILLYGNARQPLVKYAGTFRIASELRKHGYNTQCIDLTAYNKFDDTLKETLSNLITDKTLWIGISTTFLTNIFGYPIARSQQAFDKRFAKYENIADEIKRFVEFVKSLNPNIKLIAGGNRKFMIEQFGFKVFQFYADKEIIEFTEWCEGTNKNINVDFYGNLIHGSEYSDFNTSQILYTKEDIIDKCDTLPVEVSRGCIFKCKFCAFPLNGKTKGDWIKNASVLRDEFNKNYELHGVTYYSFSDDTYNDSADKVKLLFDDVFSKLNFKLGFTTYLRLDLMIRYPETVKYLQESGLKSALFGIETINHASAKSVGKGLNPKLQLEFVEEIKNNEFKNILTNSGFILGLPHDHEEDMYKLEEFIFSDKNKLDLCSVEPLYITPPTSKVNRTFYSTFDLEYEKYGYECYEQIEDSSFTDIRWTNSVTGMTFDKAFAFTQQLATRIESSSKFKYGEFHLAYIRSLGIPDQDIFSMSIPEINAKYNLKHLSDIKKEKYRQRVLELSKLK